MFTNGADILSREVAGKNVIFFVHIIKKTGCLLRTFTVHYTHSPAKT